MLVPYESTVQILVLCIMYVGLHFNCNIIVIIELFLFGPGEDLPPQL